MGIRGSGLSVLPQFQSNPSQYVVVDGCRSKLINMVSGVFRGSVLGQKLFLRHRRAFLHGGKQANAHADDFTLVAVVPSPSERVAVTESLNLDLNRVTCRE